MVLTIACNQRTQGNKSSHECAHHVDIEHVLTLQQFCTVLSLLAALALHASSQQNIVYCKMMDSCQPFLRPSSCRGRPSDCCLLLNQIQFGKQEVFASNQSGVSAPLQQLPLLCCFPEFSPFKHTSAFTECYIPAPLHLRARDKLLRAALSIQLMDPL